MVPVTSESHLCSYSCVGTQPVCLQVLNKNGVTTTNSNSNILWIKSLSDPYTQPMVPVSCTSTVMQAICSAAHLLTTENCPCQTTQKHPRPGYHFFNTQWPLLVSGKFEVSLLLVCPLLNRFQSPPPSQFKTSHALRSPQDLSHPLNSFTQNCKCACHNMWEQIPPSFYIITVLAYVPEHFHGTIQSILNINFNTVKLTLTREWNGTFWKSNQVEETLLGTERNQHWDNGQDNKEWWEVKWTVRHLNNLTQWNPYSMNVWGEWHFLH